MIACSCRHRQITVPGRRRLEKYPSERPMDTIIRTRWYGCGAVQVVGSFNRTAQIAAIRPVGASTPAERASHLPTVPEAVLRPPQTQNTARLSGVTSRQAAKPAGTATARDKIVVTGSTSLTWTPDRRLSAEHLCDICAAGSGPAERSGYAARGAFRAALLEIVTAPPQQGLAGGTVRRSRTFRWFPVPRALLYMGIFF